MKKKKIVFVVVAIVVLLALGFVYFVMPRIMIYIATREMLPECEAIAEYFTDYEVKNENTCTVSNEYFSMDIPAYLSEEKTFETDTVSATIYRTPDEITDLMVINVPNSYPMSMIEAYEEYDEEKVLEKYHITDVEKMFTSLGYGRPDSFYNIKKCVYLLDYKDYSVWSLDKMVAFSIYGILRNEMLASKVYLYEKDDIRALVECISERYVIVTVMKAEDLNTAYSFTFHAQDKNLMVDMNEVFGILNTFQFIQ